MHGFIRGACVVLFGGACVVLFGGHAWFIWGACMVLFGGRAWFYLGGHAWFIQGGMCGFIQGGACVVFSVFPDTNEIRSMSGRYTSYWNAFLFLIFPVCSKFPDFSLTGKCLPIFPRFSSGNPVWLWREVRV